VETVPSEVPVLGSLTGTAFPVPEVDSSVEVYKTKNILNMI